MHPLTVIIVENFLKDEVFLRNSKKMIDLYCLPVKMVKLDRKNALGRMQIFCHKRSGIEERATVDATSARKRTTRYYRLSYENESHGVHDDVAPFWLYRRRQTYKSNLFFQM